jgi:hypothetical protein
VVRKTPGRAVAVVVLGLAASIALLPPLAQALISSVGWREAYVALGLMVWVLLIPAAILVVRNRPEEAARTQVFLAQDATAAGTGGRFYGPQLKQRKIPPRAHRPDRRGLLWAASEELVRAYLPGNIPSSWPLTKANRSSQKDRST